MIFRHDDERRAEPRRPLAHDPFGRLQAFGFDVAHVGAILPVHDHAAPARNKPHDIVAGDGRTTARERYKQPCRALDRDRTLCAVLAEGLHFHRLRHLFAVIVEQLEQHLIGGYRAVTDRGKHFVLSVERKLCRNLFETLGGEQIGERHPLCFGGFFEHGSAKTDILFLHRLAVEGFDFRPRRRGFDEFEPVARRAFARG